MQTQNIKLGIVCPMANERKTAESFINEVLSYCKNFQWIKIFVVLDHVSQDGTLGLLQEIEKSNPCVQVVWAPENRCVVDAYVRGYKAALDAGSDWILEIDAGFSHQPKDIPQFIKQMSEGYDCVFGSRFCKGGQYRHAPLQRFLISKLGSQLINLVLGTKLSDMTSGFEFFTAKALKNVLNIGIHSKGHFFQSEIKFYCRNLKITEVPICYTNPSPRLSNQIIFDALQNLWRLYRLKIKNDF